jgi:hypothetical protein
MENVRMRGRARGSLSECALNFSARVRALTSRALMKFLRLVAAVLIKPAAVAADEKN